MLFQIIAIVLLVLFYGCYFGKMLLQRRKGIQTDQIGKGKTGRTLLIERVMKVATIAVPIGEAASILLNITCLPDWLRWAGLGIALLGTGVFICSVVTMRDSWRAGVSATDKTELVTHGIYRFSRNPAFLGFDLVYLGILLAFFSWWLLALSAFAAVMFHLQITLVEEPFLQGAFGEDYARYQRSAMRYFGRR